MASPLPPPASTPPTYAYAQMTEANNEHALDMNDFAEPRTGEKRKKEGKLRSIVWQHFTKLFKEDGTCDKCKCNHCHKLFASSSRSGTTHLLRHITEGICPGYKNEEKKEKSPKVLRYMKVNSGQNNGAVAWRYEQVFGQPSSQHPTDMDDELSPIGLDDGDRQTLADDYGYQASTPPRGKLPLHSSLRSQRRPDSWMNELRACVGKLVELTNERVPKERPPEPSLAITAPDYSISAALKCLNEMEDIPQSSEMYLDAFEALQDAGERECFICLPAEPRRRWLQRLLHRRFPLRYTYDVE